MKTCARIAIVLTVLSMGVAAQAQTCTSLITEWQGQYSISGSGTGTGSDGFNWTINESESATVDATGGAFSCTTAGWSGQGVVLTVSVNDKGVRPCGPNSAVSQETVTITGSTSGVT